MRLDGKIAIVTGAGAGFGAGIVRRLLAEGAAVACVDINPDSAAALIGELGSTPAQARAFPCDVADGASVGAMVAEVVAAFGGFDVLVNNAGITQRPRRVANLPEVEIDRLFAVNVKSIYHMAVHAHPVLRRRKGGAVINIASVTALRPRPGMTWYNASKAAVIAITQSMAAELAPDRIRVNAVAPAFGRTAMADAMFAGDEAAIDGMARTVPLGRLCAPADVAAAVAYLASDDASYVTGVILPVDGGRLIA